MAALLLAGASVISTAFAQATGGFIEKADSPAARPRWTPAQIRSFLPRRGQFTFPAPYNTGGVRLTSPSDCGGGDCVLPLSGSSGRNINNHRGRDTMLILLGLRGSGPSLFGYDKRTDQVRNLGPLFDAASPFASHSGEGWYFSATQPTRLYVSDGGPALVRYDVETRAVETVFDATGQFGEGIGIDQAHSSDDDTVHSALLRDSTSHRVLGCLAYREKVQGFSYYPATADGDECEVDKSGRWLLIRQRAAQADAEDDRIVDLETGAEKTLIGETAAAGPSDTGHGYLVAKDAPSSLAAAVRIWDFEQSPSPRVMYQASSAAGDLRHIAHANAQPDVELSRQFACGSTGTTPSASRPGEIVCFRLDGSQDVLVVAPTMVDPSAPRGGRSNPKLSNGNLDVTGRYFLWVSNTGGRADAFMVKVPADLLMGPGSDAASPDPPATTTITDPDTVVTLPRADLTAPVISAVTASAITSSGATISWTTNEPSDSQVEYGTTTAYGTLRTLTKTRVRSHAATLSGLAASTLYHFRVRSRDFAGNLAVSSDFMFTTLADLVPPAVSITAPLTGTTLAGTVTIAASASDKAGVIGVQFKLGGANLGAEDTTSPYAVSWDTTTVGVGSYTLTAVARDAAGNATTSATVNVTVANASVLTLAPQDTYIGLDATPHSTSAQLNTYTWPDNKVANAILMKFDISALPAGAVVLDATLQLALVSNDVSPDSTYIVTAHKMVGRNPVITGATGYTADGVTAWTPNACCSNNVPLAEADISAAYDSRAIDKAPGYKSWSLTAMVQEWVADPATNFGLLLNSDASKRRDRYRSFASMENPDPGLRPSLRVTYSLDSDATPPVISAVTASAITSSGAAINWTTDEPSDSQVEYGTTTAYGSLTTLNGSRVTSHAATLTGLAANTLYHSRVRSRDLAGNLAVSGDFTFTTLAADLTPPAVSITTPTTGATATGTVTVAASASDNVAVAGVQFKLDGANLGAEDATSPYSVSWNTIGATNGSHTLTAVARDAAGNFATSAGIIVTVANDTAPPSVSITAPAGGATVMGTLTVSANASDNVAVAGVQFKLDGANLGAEDATSPYSVSWNTTGATNGSHTLTAVARDGAGNVTTAAGIAVTVSNDPTPPSVSITAPAAASTVSGTVAVSANASDNVAVVGVQFKLDGANLGAEDTSSPYSVSWNTVAAVEGSHALTATARDAAGNAATSAAVNVTVANAGVLTLTPQDTYIGLDTTNQSTSAQLNTYTWPDNQIANAILMKFDLAAVPAGAVVTDATLQLALLQSDTAPETTYTVTAHKVVGKSPVVATATGYTADGVTAWTANTCCSGNVPLAQADISVAYDTRAIDKSPGYKPWSVTGIVQEWLANPTTNFGLLLNSDASKLKDRYRFFASAENPDATLRPYLRITYSLVPDVTPPVISAVLASAITSSGGSITWTTSEASDSQVEYGTTTAYGTLTTLNTARTTAHATALTGLTTNTTYHFRVRSRDAAGNLAVSGDSAFTTLAVDLTPPGVSITAPTGGTTVTGTVTVTASASDNVAVAGVQFKRDGVNLGVEDTAAPYSVSWNTAGLANGSHTLTAVARDAAANQTTSAVVTVTVANTAAGIAALYPGDAGIESHPDVIFVERFDELSITALGNRWGDTKNAGNLTFTTDVPAGSPAGGRSLNIRSTTSDDGGHLYKVLSPGIDDTLYVRYYIKYPTTNVPHHSGIWIGGNNPVSSWPVGIAGAKPSGSDAFSAGAEQNYNVTHAFDHYDYWMNMRPDGGGSYWGNMLLNSASVQAGLGQWTCVEEMVKLNNPTTAFNGEHAIWLNGVKVSHLGQGFPNGTWSGGIFTQTPSGTPFEGFRWRSTTSLNINFLWLQNYSDNVSSNLGFAYVVAARSYIGCLAP